MEDTQYEEIAEIALPTAPSETVLNAEAFLKRSSAKGGLAVEKVTLPDGTVTYVRMLGGTERERYIDSLHVSVGKGKDARREVRIVGANAKLAALSLCDKNGTRLFPDPVPAPTVQALGQMPYSDLEAITDVAARLSGLDKQGKDDAGNDSGTAPTDGSFSV